MSMNVFLAYAQWTFRHPASGAFIYHSNLIGLIPEAPLNETTSLENFIEFTRFGVSRVIWGENIVTLTQWEWTTQGSKLHASD